MCKSLNRIFLSSPTGYETSPETVSISIFVLAQPLFLGAHLVDAAEKSSVSTNELPQHFYRNNNDNNGRRNLEDSFDDMLVLVRVFMRQYCMSKLLIAVFVLPIFAIHWANIVKRESAPVDCSHYHHGNNYPREEVSVTSPCDHCPKVRGSLPCPHETKSIQVILQSER